MLESIVIARKSRVRETHVKSIYIYIYIYICICIFSQADICSSGRIRLAQTEPTFSLNTITNICIITTITTITIINIINIINYYYSSSSGSPSASLPTTCMASKRTGRQRCGAREASSPTCTHMCVCVCVCGMSLSLSLSLEGDRETNKGNNI